MANAAITRACVHRDTGSNQALRATLRVGRQDDPLEREADRIAARVVGDKQVGPIGRAPAQAQRKCAACADEEQVIQRQVEDEEAQDELRLKAEARGPLAVGAETAAAAIGLGGRPLGAAERAYFEPRFGRDLSSVRIHTEGPAARSAVAVSARAYTVGSHVAFAPGQYAPGTTAGKRLIAHELAHVVQQGARDRPVPPLSTLRIGARDDPLEREADALADATAEGAAAIAPVSNAGARVPRQDADTDEAGARYLAHSGNGTNDFGPTTPSRAISVPFVATRSVLLQRQPADAAPAAAWSPDLINIFVTSDRSDCLGAASPGSIDPYSSCGSPVRPPFCMSARVPFKVNFFVDRSNSPISQPFTPPRLRVRMQFTTTGGQRTLNTDVLDRSPSYLGPNQPLAASFGENFPVGSNESGTLTMNIEMLGVAGHDVVYTDSIQYIIQPCV